MSADKMTLPVATSEEVAAVIRDLESVDSRGMMARALEIPHQIVDSVAKAKSFHEGEIPLDKTRLHLVGLGGSAIAGELLRDMLAPKSGISVHRGTKPPRDRAGVIVSSYSGNTSEILELSKQVIGGLRTVVFFSSGGTLERLAYEWGIPFWKMPAGYQPRAAVGWSLALVASVVERWHVNNEVVTRIVAASTHFSDELASCRIENHPLIQSALPIADAAVDRTTVVFHSLRCTGAARRLAAQINENAKQPAFALVMPEALHNGVEGLVGSGDPRKWCLVFMSDMADADSLRHTMQRSINYFLSKGFPTFDFPSAHTDPFETTLSRVLVADFVSLFIAARRKIDPTPIPAIIGLKEMEPPLDVSKYLGVPAEIR